MNNNTQAQRTLNPQAAEAVRELLMDRMVRELECHRYICGGTAWELLNGTIVRNMLWQMSSCLGALLEIAAAHEADPQEVISYAAWYCRHFHDGILAQEAQAEEVA